MPALTALPMIDLFAGAGGLSIGFEQAGFHPIVAVENDASAAATYQARHDGADVITKDIRQVLRRNDLRKWRGNVVAVVGGPPCQPWSQGGLQRGAEDPRDALPSFVEAIRQLLPSAFVLENAPGLGRGANRQHLARLLAQLAALGYSVQSETLLAADFGVPQKRSRLFVVGTRGAEFRFPRPVRGPGRRWPWPVASDFITDEPLGDPNTCLVTYAKRPHVRPDPYDGLLWNGGGRPIHPGRPAPTILASGGNKIPWVDTAGVVSDYHAHLRSGRRPRSGTVEGARRITLQEAAHIQGFPKGMAFAGPSTSQFRQVGNAVPPPLAAAVGRSLARALRAQGDLN